MADITAQDVKALRDSTGAGMMDAKRALVDADGDFEAAAQALREKGLAKAATRSDRENVEGAVALAANGSRAALVPIKCDDLAQAGLADGPGALDDRAAALDDLRLAIKENIEVGRVELIEAADGNLLDTYLHVQDGRGVNGVVVEGAAIEQDTLHQVSLHVAFAKPSALTRDEVPAELVDKERAALLDITKAEGKPEQAWDKIVEGRLTGWFRDSVLLEQGLHGDKVAVKDSLGGGEIVRFVQAYLGV